MYLLSFRCSFVFLFFMWSTASGQSPMADAPPSNANARLGENKITSNIMEPKLNGTGLATLYRKFTGHRVRISAPASTTEFHFTQGASPQDPLSYANAAELLKKAALIEGFHFVPDSEDPNMELLVPTKPRPIGQSVHVVNEGDILPEGDVIFNYVMMFKHIKPADASNILTRRISFPNSNSYINVVANTSALIITSNASTIRKMIELKSEIDKP